MVQCIARCAFLIGAAAAFLIATSSAFVLPASGTHSCSSAVAQQRQQRCSSMPLAAGKDESKEVGVDDLLESPAFLNKKVEVLKKQLAKTEEDIAAANALADVVSIFAYVAFMTLDMMQLVVASVLSLLALCCTCSRRTVSCSQLRNSSDILLSCQQQAVSNTAGATVLL
jgi:uncharacterized small protein (DUF1192 family)